MSHQSDVLDFSARVVKRRGSCDRD